ncbi:MAG: DNA replication and repair protein RecF [Cyclobacteriaceae bacterium]
MYLKKLSLNNFKNYTDATVSFHPKVNCILGLNGAGKTNLLDAIYYLTFTKSAFNTIDSQNIRHTEKMAVIQGHFSGNDEMSVTCGLKVRQKKIFKVDQTELERMSDHIGTMPLVLISPDDTAIIREASEARRKFVDSTISQVNKGYLNNLMQYNHQLKQRNNLLKNWPHGKPPDKLLFEAYDEVLGKLSADIFAVRAEFIVNYKPYFLRHYGEISNDKEHIDLLYQSNLSDPDYDKNFKEALSKDLVLQRTTMGIHRDDFVLKMDEYLMKKIGSQGQQKSMVIAMKLAQFDYLKEQTNKTPLLMMDDIFDKLDDERIEKLILLIDQEKYGQVFITDARPDRSQNLLKKYNVQASSFMVEDGEINEVS